jgi:hyperosmotically inducible protein
VKVVARRAIMKAARWIALSVLAAGVALAPWPAIAADHPTDAQLQKKVEQRLFDNDVIGVKVAVASGTVTLTGTVSSVGDIQDAEDVARRTHGVRGVVNQITVSAPENDTNIAEEVAGQISDDPQYSVFDEVGLIVKDGVVTLTGAVTSEEKSRDMVRIASKIDGVRAVKNEIKTLPASTFDDELRTAVAARIYGDAVFAQYADSTDPPIHIVVDGGHVTLVGAVDSTVERQKAEIDARGVFGVLGVVNNLVVEKDS